MPRRYFKRKWQQFLKFTQSKQYFFLIKDFWFSKQSLLSWFFLVLAISFSLFYVYFCLSMNQLFAKIYDHIEIKNKQALFLTLTLYALAFFGYLFCYVIRKYLLAVVVYKWRRALSKKVQALWLSNHHYHRIKNQMENTDQRISEDIYYFCTGLVEIVGTIFLEALTLFAFIGVLWNFNSSFTFSIFDYPIQVPHYLAIGCILYSIGVNVALFSLGKPIIKLNYDNEHKEANYRHGLMRINHYSEEVAFTRAENTELEILNKKFFDLYSNVKAIAKQTLIVDIFEFGYSATLSIFPILTALPLLFSEAISLGSLMQIGSACSTVLLSLGVLVSNYQAIVTLQAAKTRLYQLLHSLRQMEHQRKTLPATSIRYGADHIAFHDVTLTTQEGRPIIKKFNLKINPGEKILILGKSGIGKTTLLRSMAHLVPLAEGHILLPDTPIYFVPQRPYLPTCTLQEFFNSPNKTTASNDDLIVSQVLFALGLHHLVDQLDVEKDFFKSLSMGELQRLNIAKVLLHRPGIVVLDEPTSSLDEESAHEVFKLLLAHLGATSTIITVSHYPGLANYHDRTIEIHADRIMNEKAPINV